MINKKNLLQFYGGGIGTNSYRWGATIEGGPAWTPATSNNDWSVGYKLDAAHDIATITWGEKWHIPSRDEWNLLVERCDYERKEANESGYGVAGYFFYNKLDRNKFIFLPVSTWSGEPVYWTSELRDSNTAYCFHCFNGNIDSMGYADINSTGLAIRSVFVE